MKRRRARDGYERFVALHHWMLKSPAWKALSPNAKAVLLEVWTRHNGSNNGEISYAVREAAEIGLGRNQASRALEECTEAGFLVCTRESAFSVKTRAARLWRITAEPAKAEPATKDFMRLSPGLKNKTQSHQRDAQSHPWDCEAQDATKEPLTVTPAGLSEPKTPTPQSHQRDTSSIPGRDASGAAGEASLWLHLLASSPTACLLVMAMGVSERALS